jgi:transposase
MVQFDSQQHALVGQAGALAVPANDEIARKLAMLIEGECEGLGPVQAAKKFGLTRQRYYQIRCAFLRGGASALVSKGRGPKRNYRRTQEVIRQILRHRFLDPEVTVEVIAQRLRQVGRAVSIRSVERVIADYGLQKKTLQVPPAQRRRKT